MVWHVVLIIFDYFFLFRLISVKKVLEKIFKYGCGVSWCIGSSTQSALMIGLVPVKSAQPGAGCLNNF